MKNIVDQKKELMKTLQSKLNALLETRFPDGFIEIHEYFIEECLDIVDEINGLESGE
jgi:hypothetical protein